MNRARTRPCNWALDADGLRARCGGTGSAWGSHSASGVVDLVRDRSRRVVRGREDRDPDGCGNEQHPHHDHREQPARAPVAGRCGLGGCGGYADCVGGRTRPPASDMSAAGLGAALVAACRRAAGDRSAGSWAGSPTPGWGPSTHPRARHRDRRRPADLDRRARRSDRARSGGCLGSLARLSATSWARSGGSPRRSGCSLAIR